MNDATHAAYEGYLLDLAHLLNLRDWDIEIERAPASSGSRATCHIHQAKDEAGVRLGEEFFARTPEQQRKTLVHELLHLHTGRMCRVVTRLTSQIDSDLMKYINSAYDEEEEIVIERLARAIAPFLPLPPDVEKE